MSSPFRDDYPGAWWHLTNRGIAKRPVFETIEDVERFYAALASVIAAGLLEIHGHTFLTTHFHLLARSPKGEISRAMKLVVNEFVRWFNRARRRDGALFRGPFKGRRIDDADYWCNVLRYIDLNPVRAGLCKLPSDHPFGSARAYRYGTGPQWLSRDEVMRVLPGMPAPAPLTIERYDEFACAGDPETNAFLVERMLHHPNLAPPPVRDLVRVASNRQQGWMEWKAALADAGAVGTAFLAPSAAMRAARAVECVLDREANSVARVAYGRDVAAGLLRHAVGLRVQEIAKHLGVARSTAHHALQRHERWMEQSPEYAALVARAVRSAVRRTHTMAAHPLDLPLRVGYGRIEPANAGVPRR